MYMSRKLILSLNDKNQLVRVPLLDGASKGSKKSRERERYPLHSGMLSHILNLWGKEGGMEQEESHTNLIALTLLLRGKSRRPEL